MIFGYAKSYGSLCRVKKVLQDDLEKKGACSAAAWVICNIPGLEVIK
jgi:hypothetical protein